MQHASFESVRVCPDVTGLGEADSRVGDSCADYKQGLRSEEMQSNLAVVEPVALDAAKCVGRRVTVGPCSRPIRQAVSLSFDMT